MITTPLIQAVLDGRIETVRSLIQTNPEMLGICSEVGSLPYRIAVNKGLANQQTALLRAAAPGSEDFSSWDGLLIYYMEDLSHDLGCAGWLSGIEFVLWRFVFTDEPMVGDDWLSRNLERLDEETKEDLRFLSRKAGGWAAWPEGEREPRFVTFEEWEKLVK
ncbi:MAG: hypothetical protein JSS81_09875 [Acidobacteria bacterium]|nr:hypothetical protein [Acidobacteriota bacterium]